MRSSVLLVATLLTMLCVSSAQAQCAFDEPAKSRGFKSDMVRAYSACPGVTFAAPNTITLAGVPACATPSPQSAYEFGPDGRCKIKVKQWVEASCYGGCGVPCMRITLKLSCKDLLESGGSGPAEGGPWAVSSINRATLGDGNGDMTVIDFASQLASGMARRGSLRINATIPWAMFEPCFGAFLPPCAAIEFLTLNLRDPDGNVFATLGSSTR